LEKNTENVEEKIKESLGGLKKEVDSGVSKIFKDRADQLNMLLHEFVKDSDPEMWKGYVLSGLSALSKEGRVGTLIKFEGLKLSVDANAENLNRDEVNKFMKLLLDFIVKKALSEFGKQQTKMIVQKVIREISEKNK